MNRDQNWMPDVPNPDFVGAVCEIWFTVNYAAYHLAYTRVYLQTRSMQTPVEELRLDDQSIKDKGQVDLIICRSHLASFFWELHHVFEALETAINRGKKENPTERHFYSQERALKTIRETSIPKEIEAYRNQGQHPGDHRSEMEKKRREILTPLLAFHGGSRAERFDRTEPSAPDLL